MTDRLILTALDGVLLSSAETDSAETDSAETDFVDEARAKATIAEYARLRPAIAQLQTLGVPVIVFTNRDRAELEPIRQQLGLVAPFITESGSAIFTPVDHNPFTPSLGEKEDNYFVLTLGCPYVQARAGLRVLANVISHPLKGFGDFTVPQLQRLAGLSERAAHQAKAREFSEPFMTPKGVESAVLQQAAIEMGFEMIVRSPQESRFSELLGAGAGIGAAMQAVIAAYQRQMPSGRSLDVMVISNCSADFGALAEPKKNLEDANWHEILTTDSAPDVWLSAIAPYLTR